MNISEKLSALNYERFHDWSVPFTLKNAKQAILAFNGGVYDGLQASTFKAADFTFAQNHLRILSGLYGVLRPLDLMQPYRLEMGTSLKTSKGKSLYDFWDDKIANSLNEVLSSHQNKVIVNLASNEYFKSIPQKNLSVQIVTPVFKEVKEGKSRTIALFAKRARGRMAAWMIQKRIDSPGKLILFCKDGYKFTAKESTENRLVFSRKQPAPVSVRAT